MLYEVITEKMRKMLERKEKNDNDRKSITASKPVNIFTVLDSITNLT